MPRLCPCVNLAATVQHLWLMPPVVACCFICAAADIDACVAFPCQQAGASTVCTDLLNAPNTTDGRSCVCADPVTKYYANDTAGCIGKGRSKARHRCPATATAVPVAPTHAQA